MVFQLFKGWFGRTEKEKLNNMLGPDDADGMKVKRAIRNNRCPDCNGKGFLEGPSGGININIMCANDECGSKFNIAGFGGELIYAERISEPQPKKMDKQ